MKRTLALCFCICFFLFIRCFAQAEERKLFVGDLIELKITTHAFSEEEIREKFRDFEIVALEKKPDGYQLTLRTFETGEKVIQLGDKEIIIDVQSALEEYERDDVFEGSPDVLKSGFSPDWRIFAGFSAALFLASAGILLGKSVGKRKLSRLTPLQKFMKAADQVSLAHKDAFVELTLCLKEYLESSFSLRIRGKTSREIMKELAPVEELREHLPEIRSWLDECDYLKFSGNEGSMERRQELFLSLKSLAESIDATKGGKT
jgi:hypothetical protein